MEPKIVPRSEHGISRRNIDPDALKILYRLHRHGHKAYIVGGGVRDLMLGVHPKDFDIATDARPRKLKRLFRNCRIIGRRFRLAHLHFPGNKIIEVATFRSTGKSDQVERDGELIRRDNVFGTPSEDAIRRDLTINGLFYSIADFSVIDYVGGVDDLHNRTVRMIGDPVRSFREDPVRILRAIRHATRLDFDFDEQTAEAIESEKQELLKVNQARLLEELYKDLCSGVARPFFETLHERGILDVLVPDMVDILHSDVPGDADERTGLELLLESLDRLDRLTAEGQNVTHAIGLSALFAPIVVPVACDVCENGAEPHPPSGPFRAALEPVFTNLSVYRRDEERLWQVLGAWIRMDRAFERNRYPTSFTRRAYFPEVVEVFGLLMPQSPDLTSFIEEGRSFPPPDPEPPRRPRRRRRRGKGDGQHHGDQKRREHKGHEDKHGSSQGGHTQESKRKRHGTEGDSRNGSGEPGRKKRRRRRRRRRPPARTGEQHG